MSESEDEEYVVGKLRLCSLPTMFYWLNRGGAGSQGLQEVQREGCLGMPPLDYSFICILTVPNRNTWSRSVFRDAQHTRQPNGLYSGRGTMGPMTIRERVKHMLRTCTLILPIQATSP